MIQIEKLMPMNNWRVTVQPEGLPWAGTTVILTDEEMEELVRRVEEERTREE